MKRLKVLLALCLVVVTFLCCKCYSSADLLHPNGYFKLLPMTVEPRQGHTATLLQDGRVLIAGGRLLNGTEISKTAEIYDPKANKFTKTGDMTTPRVEHAAILLQDGKVLITGGRKEGMHTSIELNSAEIYDPKTEKFTKINDMNHAWVDHNMILLPDGRVLLCSNISNLPINFKLEIYNPENNKFQEKACLTERCPENAVILNNEMVLLASGEPDNQPQLFDFKTEIFKYTDKMKFNRSSSTAILLKNGEAIIIGGSNNYTEIANAEIYSAATGKFRLAGKLNKPRYSHSAILLSDGKILVVGGESGHSNTLQYLKSAELYNPVKDKFIKISDMHYIRGFRTTLTLLKNGNVLIIGARKRPELYISK